MGTLFSRNFDPLTDLVDLQGKVAIVTGANTGIGLATVQHLTRAGAKVYLAARNESRATAAITQLNAEGFAPGNGEVVWLKLDLSDPRAAKESAQDFLALEKRLDILVNNAAVMESEYKVDKDGISAMATVNYVSPFVFTRTLLPLLKTTASEPDSDVRIVNLSSIVHKFVPTPSQFKEIGDLNVQYTGRPLSGLLRYGHSKLLGLLWTRSLQNYFNTASPPIPITAIAVHPGGVDTFSHKARFPGVTKFFYRLAIPGPEIGAYNSAFAAAGKRIRGDKTSYQGAYLESQPTGKLTEPSVDAMNAQLGTELWETTEQFLAKIGV